MNEIKMNKGTLFILGMLIGMISMMIVAEEKAKKSDNAHIEKLQDKIKKLELTINNFGKISELLTNPKISE